MYSRHMNPTPYEIAAALHGEEYFAFLDSSRTGNDQGRYSILAWRPRSVLRMKNENPFPAIDRLFSSAGPEHCFGNRVTDASSSASYHPRFCSLHSETPLGVQPAQQF